MLLIRIGLVALGLTLPFSAAFGELRVRLHRSLAQFAVCRKAFGQLAHYASGVESGTVLVMPLTHLQDAAALAKSLRLAGVTTPEATAAGVEISRLALGEFGGQTPSQALRRTLDDLARNPAKQERVLCLVGDVCPKYGSAVLSDTKSHGYETARIVYTRYPETSADASLQRSLKGVPPEFHSKFPVSLTMGLEPLFRPLKYPRFLGPPTRREVASDRARIWGAVVFHELGHVYQGPQLRNWLEANLWLGKNGHAERQDFLFRKYVRQDPDGLKLDAGFDQVYGEALSVAIMADASYIMAANAGGAVTPRYRQELRDFFGKGLLESFRSGGYGVAAREAVDGFWMGDRKIPLNENNFASIGETLDAKMTETIELARKLGKP